MPQHHAATSLMTLEAYAKARNEFRAQGDRAQEARAPCISAST